MTSGSVRSVSSIFQTGGASADVQGSDRNVCPRNTSTVLSSAGDRKKFYEHEKIRTSLKEGLYANSIIYDSIQNPVNF